MKKLSIFIIINLIAIQSMAQSTSILPNRLDFAQRTYSQILAIPTPQKGSTCYDTDNNCLRIYDGSTWRVTAAAASGGFNDATGCCSGAYTAGNNLPGGPPAITQPISFNQSTAYSNELYEVGYCPGISAGLIYYGFGTGAITTNNKNIGFVSKYDANGTNLWIAAMHHYSSSAVTTVNAVKVDASGVYIIGTFSNTLTVATPSPTTLTSAGGTDIFVMKLDAATGAFVWAKQFGGAGNDTGVDLTLGESGFIYFTGMTLGLTIGYCSPSPGVFVGKLNQGTGASIGDGGVINDPISSSLTISSILFYNSKVLLIGSFVGSAYPAYVVPCAGSFGVSGTALTGTAGREIYISSFDTNLIPTTYKMVYAGNDAADNLNPLRATLESGFSGGTYSTKLKICANPVGNFPLGSRTINGGGFILTLNLNGSILPTINEVITLQGGTFTGFGDGYAVGACTSTSSNINGTATFGGSTGQNFMLSTTASGLFNWIITSNMLTGTSGGLGTQSTKTISKLCSKVFAFGAYTNAIQLCSVTLDAGTRNHAFWWQYNDCGGCCN
jgi:hypothetical protein